MATEEAFARSLANVSQRQREIDRCCVEIDSAQNLLRAGHPDIEGLCLALADWSAELRIILEGRE
jgi:enolase